MIAGNPRNLARVRRRYAVPYESYVRGRPWIDRHNALSNGGGWTPLSD